MRCALVLPLALACNATSPYVFPKESEERLSSEEVCDHIDNDLDTRVDEDFRTDAGVYLHDEHCGRCGAPCVPDQVTEAVRCEMTDRGPACLAVSCIDGYVPGGSSTCVPWGGWLCLPCLDPGECGGFDGAACAEIAGELRCTTSCIDGECPVGYTCREGLCIPPSGSCNCFQGDRFSISCTIDVDGEPCFGIARCDNGTLSPCAGSPEVCDLVDNDCDGETDEPFVDENGRYTVDLRHCGACGVDCTLNQVVDFEITCGGPSLAPVCSIFCEDTVDGRHVGDYVDADLAPDNGCECEILSLGDAPGIDDPGAPDQLDANCDGADGIVEESFYVIPTGDDRNPGTPDAPFATVQGAVDAAVASLTTGTPRPHVFVAAGVYAEALDVKNGVNVHGGYRPDFLARDFSAYSTELHAPSWEGSPGGAALVAERDSGVWETSIDHLVFRGASAPYGGFFAAGAFLDDPGPGLTLSDITIRAGDGSDGENGPDGPAGASPEAPGGDGSPQKAAVEDDGYNCIDDERNTNPGGSGGYFVCEGTVVSGGAGGNSTCAVHYEHAQPAGSDGQGYSGAGGGQGGSGGWDAVGPIIEGGIVHCGLADFTVSGSHEMAADGRAGEDGRSGTGGAGCADYLGEIIDDTWSRASASPGENGSAGAGGGGGGAGGSAIIDGSICGFADGIGGGGGGGGSGGCGGSGGTPGTSGGPSIGVIMVLPNETDVPTLFNVEIITGIAGDGGHGGDGGDGGQGGQGGRGGELLPTERTIPSLSGPDSGGHGGPGGVGGRGGGGGGGCGGATLGIWVVAAEGFDPGATDDLVRNNTFNLGHPGKGGDNGFGGASGSRGQDGASHDVYVR